MVSGSKKTFTTKEVSQKIFETDLKIFHLILTQKTVKKMKKIENHVIGSPSLLLMKKMSTLMSILPRIPVMMMLMTVIFFTIMLLRMVMMSSNFIFFKSENFESICNELFRVLWNSFGVLLVFLDCHHYNRKILRILVVYKTWEVNWKANAKIFWPVLHNIFSNISVKLEGDWNMFAWDRWFQSWFLNLQFLLPFLQSLT